MLRDVSMVRNLFESETLSEFEQNKFIFKVHRQGHYKLFTATSQANRS